MRRGARADQLIVEAERNALTCAQFGDGRETSAGPRAPAPTARAPRHSRAPRDAADGGPFILACPPRPRDSLAVLALAMAVGCKRGAAAAG